jgi:ABC-type Fe3+/spermidine/putrescine transport system ATPase subunit
MARAVVTRPRVLLLDEPLSALDRALRTEMQIELRRIQREVAITTIFVTHDQEEALTLSDRIAILKDGRLIREGSPQDVYDNPGDVFTARFLGDANVLTGTVSPEGLTLPGGHIVRAGRPFEAPFVAVRPEHVRLGLCEPSDGNRLPAVLVERVFSGAFVTCVINWNGHTLKATGRRDEFAGLPQHGPVWLSWAPERTIPLSAGE